MKKDIKDIKDTKDIDKSYKLNKFKSVQSTGIALIMALLVLVASIPFNLIASRLKIDFDMTPNSLYSLTETSVNMAKSLHNKIDVYLLFDLEALSTDGGEPMYYAISQYDSFDNINVVKADPTTDDGVKTISELQLEESVSSGLKYSDILIKSGNIVKKVDGASMFFKETSEDGKTITIKGFTGENAISSAIKYVDNLAMAEKQPVNYFLTGHGEKSITDNYSNIVGRIRQEGYKIAELNLSQTGEVPDDAKLIVVAGPTKDISKEERDLISEFLDNGGSITFLMSPNADKMEYTNISSIMAKYAIAMNYDRVSDEENMLESDPYLFRVELLGATSESAVDLTSQLMGLEAYVSNSRSFYSTSDGLHVDLTVEPLMQANDTAIGEPYGGTNPDPDPTKGGMYLSYYAMDKSRNNSKILVLGDADFIDNEFLNGEYAYNMATYYMFLNSINWTNDSDINLGIPVKEKTNDYITVSENSDSKEVEKSANNLLILFYAIPIAVAGIGVLVWSRRRVS